MSDEWKTVSDDWIVAALAALVPGLRSRSRRDLVHFLATVRAGDDGWAVIRSAPAGGEDQIDVRYYSRLGSMVRRCLG